MKSNVFQFLILAFSLFCHLGLAKTDAEKILREVDAIRNPSGSYEMEVDISSLGSDEVSTFLVKLKGNNKTLVKTLAPNRDKGRLLLMLDENMWVYMPNLKRSLRVSLAQKLTGQAANGDITRTRWVGDYKAELENEDKQSYILLLNATKKGLTYDKIRVWVEKKNYRPLKVEFLSLSKLVLKTGLYKNYKKMAGKERPTTIELQDAHNAKDQSTILIKNIVTKDFNDSLFNQKNLH